MVYCCGIKTYIVNWKFAEYAGLLRLGYFNFTIMEQFTSLVDVFENGINAETCLIKYNKILKILKRGFVF